MLASVRPIPLRRIIIGLRIDLHEQCVAAAAPTMFLSRNCGKLHARTSARIETKNMKGRATGVGLVTGMGISSGNPSKLEDELPANLNKSVLSVRRGQHLAGSSICIAPRTVISCVHVVSDVSDSRPVLVNGALEERARGSIAVQDVDSSWCVPELVLCDLARDLAVLRFREPLKAPPGTVACHFTAQIARHLSRDNWHALGYPGDTGGGRLTDAAVMDGISVAEGDVHAGTVTCFQLTGGVGPGFSGGALIWNGHATRPIVGMPRLGGRTAAATSALGMDVILGVLQGHGFWPARTVCMPDLLDAAATAADELDRRRRAVAEWFLPTIGLAGSLGVSLSALPQGRIALPDGRLRDITRPVAIMSSLASTTLCGMPLAAIEAATRLSRHDAEQVALRIPCRSGHWRLPTRAEWWMGVSAGNRPVQQRAASGWQIQPAPGSLLEWLAPEPGEPDGAVDGRGRFQPVNPAARVDRIGFRLVWDPLERHAP